MSGLEKFFIMPLLNNEESVDSKSKFTHKIKARRQGYLRPAYPNLGNLLPGIRSAKWHKLTENQIQRV